MAKLNSYTGDMAMVALGIVQSSNKLPTCFWLPLDKSFYSFTICSQKKRDAEQEETTLEENCQQVFILKYAFEGTFQGVIIRISAF